MSESIVDFASPEASCTPRMSAPVEETAQTKLELVWGVEGLSRVREATVVVFGLGGVGSNCVEALARGGVGKLVLIDCDVVQPSNINRQAIAFHSTIGRRKTEVMRAMIVDINPDANVLMRDMFVLPDNLETLFFGDEALASLEQVDYVVDAIDTVAAKLAIAELCQREGVRLVSSMGAANKLHPECFRFADLYQTQNCPLCRAMRKSARKRGIERLRVLYSCEVPVENGIEPIPGETPVQTAKRARERMGTASYVPPIMGQMIAGDVLLHLAGVEDA